MEFLPAVTLKEIYDVYGHFYSIQLTKHICVECRSVLEIVERSAKFIKPEVISKKRPDAVFIMMNPGSSKPLCEVNNVVKGEEISDLQISLVPTKPDTTQYQVMRIMKHAGWKHVRVLNLSDLRSPKSPIFCKQFHELETEHSFEAHSIFSNVRKDERLKKIPRNYKSPVILAWGVSDKLSPLINRCLKVLPTGSKTVGLIKEGTSDRYLHPLPTLQRQKLEWVERMVKALNQ
ncbi:DUF1643 domain-containing protein [uncultured Rubinisphaera sp.]|uniref:DUF1643 domain-containing protein n=1 Tax=uncultured Rubinisphaera sp. TaxID=1678686 RepID=UPI0030D89436|tara:strand:+ start:371 stop:1069 length:699 start_codon:yes stop_codon:yes gene_type:complete